MSPTKQPSNTEEIAGSAGQLAGDLDAGAKHAPPAGRAIYRFRAPELRDGAAVYELVKQVGGLELNSAYAYLLWCERYAGTCQLAFAGEQLAGVVLGFRPPLQPDTVFVWQVGVHPSARRTGLGQALLRELVDTAECRRVRFMEAHVATGNLPSEALFRGFAQAFGGELQVLPGFAESDFPIPHEAERLFRIGPFKRPTPLPSRRRQKG